MGLKGRLTACWGVIVKMQDAEKLSLEQILALIEATQEVRFAGKDRAEMYRWISRTLRQQQYREQGKRTRGLLRRYVGKSRPNRGRESATTTGWWSRKTER